jgi:hypothetical protein
MNVRCRAKQARSTTLCQCVLYTEMHHWMQSYVMNDSSCSVQLKHCREGALERWTDGMSHIKEAGRGP